MSLRISVSLCSQKCAACVRNERTGLFFRTFMTESTTCVRMCVQLCDCECVCACVHVPICVYVCVSLYTCTSLSVPESAYALYAYMRAYVRQHRGHAPRPTCAHQNAVACQYMRRLHPDTSWTVTKTRTVLVDIRNGRATKLRARRVIKIPDSGSQITIWFNSLGSECHQLVPVFFRHDNPTQNAGLKTAGHSVIDHRCNMCTPHLCLGTGGTRPDC